MSCSYGPKGIFLLFASALLILPFLAGCGPSAADLAAVDYTPRSGSDWKISTPEKRGLSPALVAKLYYEASQLETV